MHHALRVSARVVEAVGVGLSAGEAEAFQGLRVKSSPPGWRCPCTVQVPYEFSAHPRLCNLRG
eukprot:9965896-Alexandrium_andersonii.AAC.1